jgi:hypothetical protein
MATGITHRVRLDESLPGQFLIGKPIRPRAQGLPDWMLSHEQNGLSTGRFVVERRLAEINSLLIVRLDNFSMKNCSKKYFSQFCQMFGSIPLALN